jgi:hypothetical protein
MKQNETKKSQKSQYFFCEKCEYKTDNKKDYNKHKLTRKHLGETDVKQKNTIFTCECDKLFYSRTTLWRHKKKCLNKKEEVIENYEETNEEIDLNDKNLIISLIQQNTELQKQMLEVIKNSANANINNTINNNINSNNKSFNLQVFLNETCKDAMNIMDFVDSIKIQLSDVESIGELGYVNGISKLIIKHLNALDEHMRPVHCSDPKRDILYVKDQNVWEKEDADNKKLKKVLKYISHKNICALPEWRAKYPDCLTSESNKSDQYNRMVIEAMGGSGDNDAEKADKIIKKIAKAVVINKNVN